MDKIVRNQSLLSLIACLFLIALSGNVQGQCLVTTGPTNNCTYGDAIDNITINAVSVSNAGCSGTSTGYTYFPSPIWNFTLGSSYPISLAVGGNTYNQGVRIWIDINNNGQFESTESVYSTTAAALTHSGTLVLPATGATATVRMRVMCRYNGTPAATDACTSNLGSYGETEDYQVNLTPAVVPGPDASAGMVISPSANGCGNAQDSVQVRIYNFGTVAVNNLPVVTTLTGLGAGSFNNTVPVIAPGDSATIFVTTVNSLLGGNLGIEVVTQDTMDTNPANDTLDQSITIFNGEDITITGPTSVCDGSDATLQLNTVPGETYTWYENSTSGPMIVSADSLVATGLTSDTTFAVSSSNTCRAVDTISIAVLSTDPIVVTGPDSLCDGDPLVLNLNALPGENYTWYLDSLNGTVVGNGIPYSNNATLGATTFVAASTNGCRPAGTFNLVVLALPTASFTSSVSNDTATFTQSVANATSFFWDFGDGNTSTQADPTHVYGSSGTFNVCLTAINDCDSVVVCNNVTAVLLSIPGYSDASINVFPNPTTDKITVQLSNMEGLEGEWSITDLQGRTIFRKDFKLSNGNDETVFSMGSLASGTYIFNFQTEGYSYRSMIMKK